ncbi:MAG: hypothetical protein A3A86_08225 [Elusimicrobia bacterium RIFCSPLOWO2_01_FULL_60_11]|nr:MAG: hypothetical protein A3A86_08225 [Elusimicrobia bacterium RIFCSPLOWO2_01_FULL_60_11]
MRFENFETLRDELYSALKIGDLRCVEIESKKRVLPRQVKKLRKFMAKSKRTRHIKTTYFFDQFLDTTRMDIFRRGASLRLRFKKGGSKVYLQYKGPGFLEDTLLFRSEFSTRDLKGMALEESHHDIIHFTKTSIAQILRKYAHKRMVRAMKAHLGESILSRISSAKIISLYQKDKYSVDLGKDAFLEPSVDKVSAFYINKRGPYPLSTFYEYENEIKAEGHSLASKLRHLPALLKFDRKVVRRFRLKPEKLDKYHRCASIFFSHRGR